MRVPITADIVPVLSSGAVDVNIRGGTSTNAMIPYFYPNSGKWSITFDVSSLEELRPLKDALDNAFAEAEQTATVTT